MEFITILLGVVVSVAIILMARFIVRWAIAQWKVSRLMRKSTRWYHRWQFARSFMTFVDADGIDFDMSECEEVYNRVQKEFWLAVQKREEIRFW